MKYPFFLAVLVLSTATGCDSPAADDDATAEPAKRVVLHTTVATDPASKAQFTTNFGWKVTLDKAAVAIGAVYYFNGPPAFASLETKPSLWQRAASLFEGTAYAHPGHYQAGDALGQMLTASSYDLLSAAAAPLADGEGRDRTVSFCTLRVREQHHRPRRRGARHARSLRTRRRRKSRRNVHCADPLRGQCRLQRHRQPGCQRRDRRLRLHRGTGQSGRHGQPRESVPPSGSTSSTSPTSRPARPTRPPRFPSPTSRASASSTGFRSSMPTTSTTRPEPSP